MDKKYLRPGFDFCLAHALEEAGEFVAAAGKTLRWGTDSVNPELPPEKQESNLHWMMRELADLKGAVARLENSIEKEFGVAASPSVDEMLEGEK